MSKEKKEFPKTIGFWRMLGPSFLVLAMGLGSGEVILWPYLVANYGLGIAWGAVLGISMQFFMNMEIERYALIKGESVFVGLFKKYKWTSYWFILSTFIGFALPGIVSASAKIVGSIFGLEEFKYMAILMLVAIGLLLTVSQSVYGTMERITKVLIVFCVPFVFGLVLMVADNNTWNALLEGFVGKGDGYYFLPSGISIATFLAAFAYSGAGGNLNLTQSIYIKEKGYGMGKYSQKISGSLRKGEVLDVDLEGHDFVGSKENYARFRDWWWAINKEHFIVFWFIGILSMLLLMVLAFATTYGLESNKEGISFVLMQGEKLGEVLGYNWGVALLAVLGVLLFQTQLGLVDSTSRIMGECAALISQSKRKNKKVNLSKFYFVFVWSQILFGILLFLFDIYEPKGLIVLGAVINAFAMLVHTILVRNLNQSSFSGIFATSLFRKVIIWMTIAFFGVFSLYNLISLVL